MGQRIRTLRIQQQLTQEELAQRLNMSQQTISRIEKEVDMPISTAVSLARFFNVSLDYLCGLSTTKHPQSDVIDDHTQELLYRYNSIETNHQSLVDSFVDTLLKKYPKE
ncbi:helix-turn-helix transcriptional regulator [Aerococcaceae bacterium zg-BR9]|nr:helix-turn-helix transcriptional regulator [Aerococcaceae bacterium zg-1292]MBF6625039.1 helix-turn-helix transcriptional regulator [Aerococcaceae bacterium zg-BR9]MBF6626306.1 helix-turn-helix transcriptional regulator [Aerococcaceae bacterium zg-BR9]MBF6978154.1 helix-turn-helix transcriptional regulator [Aerococcaceae bacterium zg-BR22]